MRIGRLGFVLGHVPLVVVATWHEQIAVARLLPVHPDLASPILLLGCLAGVYFLMTLRCHDFNQTVWRTFWTGQMPIIGSFWALWELLATPGTDGMNSFGHPSWL